MKNKQKQSRVSMAGVVRYVKKITLGLGLLTVPILAMADNTDPFAGSKDSMNTYFGSSSSLHFDILVVGFVITLVAGVVTKNWVASIGGFVALLIFINVAGTAIGLT